MPTFVTITVKPSGGDFASLNSALTSIGTNFVTDDKQVTIECDTFVGGLAEQVTIPTITQDSTRYLVIKAAAGHEYNPATNAGFYLTSSVGFNATLSNSQNFTEFYDIGVKNTRTLANGRGFDNFGANNVIRRCYSMTASSSGAICFFLNNADALDISECLSYLGTTGFDFGNNFTRTADKLTAIDASAVGIDTGTADTTITNSLTLGSSNPYLGTFNAASSNNAGSSTDTPGTSPQNNRTTSDLADYAGGDYRTASGSTLATAGVGGTWIGYALEAGGGGVTADVEFTITAPTFNASASATLPSPVGDIDFTIDKPLFNANGSASLPNPIGDIGILISKPVFDSSGSATLPQPTGNVSITLGAPTFSGNGGATVPYPQGSISFDVLSPFFSATGSSTQPNPSGDVSFDVSTPLFNVNASVTLPNPSGNASFTINSPTFSVNGGASLPYPVGNVSITINEPVFNASGGSTLPQPSATVEFDINKPIFMATGTVSGLVVPLGVILTPVFGSNVLKLQATSNIIKL